MAGGIKKLLLACLLAITVMSDTVFPQAASAIMQWVPRRAFKEIWGIRVRTIVVNPIEDLSRYDRAEIVTLENELMDLAPPNLNDKLTAEIAEAVNKLELFSQVEIAGSQLAIRKPTGDKFALTVSSDFNSIIVSPAVSMGDNKHEFEPEPIRSSTSSARESKTLLIKGALVDYYKGHRILRLLHLGLGRGTIVVHLQFLDKESGEELGRASIAGDLLRSFWGSTENSVPKAIAKKAAALLKENHRPRNDNSNTNRMGGSSK